MVSRPLVLVANDRATDVKRTMDVALRVAEAREADVHVMSVVPHRAAALDARLGRWGDAPFDRAADGRSRLMSMPRPSDDGVDVRSVTLRGEPERVIPAYARLHQASVLVVEGTYGTPRFWRSGRVVDELARQSPIPLLVMPKRQSREQGEPGLRRILTPIDFSIASAVALRTSVDLSRRHGARLTLVHALEDVPGHMVFSGSEAWEVIRRLPARLNAVADRLRRKAGFFGAADVDTEVATGTAEGAILETAARSKADLVVMGVARRSWLDRVVFGSTLRRVVRRATVPLLIVPIMAGAETWPEAVVDQLSSTAWNDAAVGRRRTG
jgi:nucleotide-binding universal stress UspA family protein